MSYKEVQEALAQGVEPTMLCATCPWDRYCITPPSMTKGEVDQRLDEAKAKDEADRKKAEAEGKSPNLPMGQFIMALAVSGKDLTASCCPVFVTWLRSSAGRGIVDGMKATMQGWDDNAVAS